MNPSLPSLARRIAVLVTVLVFSLVPRPASGAPDEASFHEELRQLKTVYETAMSTGDLSPLESLFTAESSGVVVDNQIYTSFAELKAIYDHFRTSFPQVVYRVKLNPEISQLFGDVAVARGTCDEYVKTSKGEFTYTSTWTAVLRRVDGHWKLVRSQVTMDPFRNSIVLSFLAKTKLYFGGGGLALGLLVGLIGARVFRGKPKTA